MNLKDRVKHFWNEFMLQKDDLMIAIDENDQNEISRIVEYFNSLLKNITTYKMEVEKSETGFYEISFVTQGNKNAQFATTLLKKDAPKQLSEDFLIHAFHPPVSDNTMMKGFKIDDEIIYGSDLIVYYTILEECKMLDLRIYSEKLKAFNEEQQNAIAFSFVELFIGELELEARINSIEVIDEEDHDCENFAYLPNFFEDLCDIIYSNDWVEYHEPLSIYQVFKLNEDLKNDTLRNDMVLIMTTNPQLQIEVLNNVETMCHNFKAIGGEYGYLYYEKTYQDEKEALLRQQLEKQIDELFFDMSIAKTMGGALGKVYTYIDVAIYDKDLFMISLAKLNEKLPFTIYYNDFMHI